MIVLVTGSSGLIGSEAVVYYGSKGAVVHGIDNNQRREFFGPPGDTSWNLKRLQAEVPSFIHHDLGSRVLRCCSKSGWLTVIHPSHW